MKTSILALLVVLAGCAGMQDAMTPSVRVFKDDFDGSIVVRQTKVGAASSLSEPIHLLGFEWSNKLPDVVFITVGVSFRAQSIHDVAFNADGQIFAQLRSASALTDIDRGGGIPVSSRRFEVPLRDFLIIASSKIVKMRIDGINDYTVSSFGPGAGDAVVNSKFGPFIDEVRKLTSKP